MHFYFFCSSNDNDGIYQVTIITTDRIRAYVLAKRYFIKVKAIGHPVFIAI